MHALKRFMSAATAIADIELVYRIREGQFNLAITGIKHDVVSAAVWNVLLFDR